MNLFFNKFLSNLPIAQPPSVTMRGARYSSALQGPDRDTFSKADGASEISFTGRRSSGSTKKGDVLKELDNITCPYSGVKMISTKKMDRIERELGLCHNIHERLEVLEPYQKCMQNLEKDVYSILKGYEINCPEGTINDCLNEMKPECLAALRIDEFKVLDEVDNASNKLDAKTALEVRKITTEARKKIIEDKDDQIFKRKDLLAQIHEVTQDSPNQDVVEEMWAIANNLPRSSNNFNAFIVKYADRSPQEIAARLLRPSTVSIEHIRPANPHSDDIESGENDMTNFMLASRDWNSGRGNTPLPEFIQKHPNIPRYTQMYINDIMKAIKKGKLVDHDWYPYIIKETLYQESGGLIDLNLERYHISEGEAFLDAPDNVREKYNRLLEQNTAKRALSS